MIFGNQISAIVKVILIKYTILSIVFSMILRLDINGEDGVHAVACTLAAIRSAQEGQTVTVAEIEPDYTAY
jgi:hypothetical protein